MKKIIFGMAALALVAMILLWNFRLFPNNQNTTYVGFEEWIQQIADEVLGLTYEEQQEIIARGRAHGTEVDFRLDGSVTFESEDGSSAIINPDGTIVFRGIMEDGVGIQHGGAISDNELTRLIPTPNFEVFASMGDEDEYTIASHSATLVQIREYVERCKAMGFTFDVDERLDDAFGNQFFTFTARNSAGNTLNITYSRGSAAIIIESQ